MERKHWLAMRRQVDRWMPLEGCGLLAGKGEIVELCLGIPNQERSPLSFRMPARWQWRAFQKIESAGLDLLAIFHSHPAGPDFPSARDIAECMYPVVQVIWSHQDGHWEARGFMLQGGQAVEIPLQVLPAE